MCSKKSMLHLASLGHMLSLRSCSKHRSCCHHIPTLGLSKVQMLFSCLKEAGYKVTANIQEMLLLMKLPSSMDVVAQIIVQAKDMAGNPADPTVEGIYKAVVLSWDQCHKTGKGKQPVQANKISAVKPKGKEPTFHS